MEPSGDASWPPLLGRKGFTVVRLTFLRHIAPSVPAAYLMFPPASVNYNVWSAYSGNCRRYFLGDRLDGWKDTDVPLSAHVAMPSVTEQSLTLYAVLLPDDYLELLLKQL